MSSPTSRPPIDPSDWAPRATRERAGMERHSAEAENDPLRSPYGLKQPHGRVGAERHPSANDLVGTSHAPGQMPAHAAMTPPSGAVDATAAEHPRRDETSSVVDLERLEESPRWLQRQEAAVRLPRVAPLPLVRGLTPPDTPRYSRADPGIRRPKSLEPDWMPPPPAAPRRRYLGASLGLLVASIAAGAVGYYVARAGWWAPGNHVATSSAPTTVASVALVGPRERDPTVAREDDPDALRAREGSDRARAIAQATKLSERSAMAMVPASELEAQIPAGSKAPRALDSDEIKLLIKQGERFAAAGDLVSARVVLQRAAQAGDATAAMALGATYDPIVLAKIGVMGLSADVEQARSWYQKAESLGSSEATRRLQILAR
jgi:hypothetical protein